MKIFRFKIFLKLEYFFGLTKIFRKINQFRHAARQKSKLVKDIFFEI